MHEEETSGENETTTILVTAALGRRGAWQLSLLSDSLRIEAVEGGESFEIPRAEVPSKADLTQLWPLAPALAVKVPKKITFNVKRAEAAAIRAWWPPATYGELRDVFKKRFWWGVGIGALLLLLSLPSPGDPKAGIQSLPFDIRCAILGGSVVVFSAMARWLPFRNLFLAECVCCLAVAVDTSFRVALRESHWAWLVFVWFLISTAYSEFQQWKRFAVLSEPEVAPPPGDDWWG